MRPQRRSYGSKAVSKAYNRASLLMVLVQRASLEGLSVESLARSHGMTPAAVEQAIGDERARRAQQ